MILRRLTGCLALTLGVLALAPTGIARADHRPVIVVPGRADVPVFIDGVEASGAVVTGEWGLHRPGHVGPTIYPDPYYGVSFRRHGYYPSAGERPRYGRVELEDRSARPARSETYYRAWSAQSGDAGADLETYYREPVSPAPRFGPGYSK